MLVAVMPTKKVMLSPPALALPTTRRLPRAAIGWLASPVSWLELLRKQ
jgi:hypothetical protein